MALIKLICLSFFISITMAEDCVTCSVNQPTVPGEVVYTYEGKTVTKEFYEERACTAFTNERVDDRGNSNLVNFFINSGVKISTPATLTRKSVNQTVVVEWWTNVGKDLRCKNNPGRYYLANGFNPLYLTAQNCKLGNLTNLISYFGISGTLLNQKNEIDGRTILDFVEDKEKRLKDDPTSLSSGIECIARVKATLIQNGAKRASEI